MEKLTDLSDNYKMGTLQRYEQQIADKKYENAIVIDKTGQIYKIEGYSSNSIYLKDLRDKLEESYVTHNHPKDETYYSLSAFDISEFMEIGIQKLRGIDDKYIYEIERTADTIKVDGDLVRHEFGNNYRYEALDIIRKENKNADTDEYHIINQLLAKKYKYKYKYRR